MPVSLAMRKSVFFRKFRHQLYCDFGAATALDQKIEHLAFVVYGAPKPVLITADRDHHLIEIPVVARPRPRAPDVGCDGRNELEKPLSNGLVGDINSPFDERFLDSPE